MRCEEEEISSITRALTPEERRGNWVVKNPCLTPSLLFSGSRWKKKKMFDRSDFPASGRKKYTGKKRNFFIFFSGEKTSLANVALPETPGHLQQNNDFLFPP